MKFKMTPLILFILLLVILVISMFVGRRISEGFANATEIGKKVKIPQYVKDRELHKLGDNLFFDSKNANLVEVSGETKTETIDPNDPQKKKKIVTYAVNKLHIMDRTGNIRNVSITGTEDLTKNTTFGSVVSKTTVDDSFTSKMFYTSFEPKRSVVYVAWGKKTRIAIINNVTKTLNNTFLFGPSDLAIFNNESTPLGITGRKTLDKSNNNTLVSETQYSDKRKVHQLSQFVKYDFKTGDIVLHTKDKKTPIAEIWSRDSNSSLSKIDKTKVKTMSITDPAQITSITTFPVSKLVDKLGQTFILYMPHEKETVVVMLTHATCSSNAPIIISDTFH